MNDHDFLPGTCQTSEEAARLAWMRGHLEHLGIWTGFPNSTSANLSNLYRYGHRLDGSHSVMVELEENGMSLPDLEKLVRCLPRSVCNSLASTWVEKGKLDRAEMVMPFLQRHQLEALIDVSISRKIDSFFDKHAPSHANTQALGHLKKAITSGNDHAGPWLLAHSQLDVLDILRELKNPAERTKIDAWWATGLESCAMAPPAMTRTMRLWRKRLPSVDACLRRAALAEIAATGQVRVERKGRVM